jgi:hypothetical protein
MSNRVLRHLADDGKLVRSSHSKQDVRALVRSARRLLVDAAIENVSVDGRFNLIYSASHALAIALMAGHGFHSANKSLLFQSLQHTACLTPAECRILMECHDRRVQAESGGLLDVNENLVDEAADLAWLLLEQLFRVRLQR